MCADGKARACVCTCVEGGGDVRRGGSPPGNWWQWRCGMRGPSALQPPTEAVIDSSHSALLSRAPPRSIIAHFLSCFSVFFLCCSNPPQAPKPYNSRLTLLSYSFSTTTSIPRKQRRVPGKTVQGANAARPYTRAAALRFIQNHASSSCRRLPVGAGGHDRGPGQCAGGLVPVRGRRAAFSRHCEWYVLEIMRVKEKEGM